MKEAAKAGLTFGLCDTVDAQARCIGRFGPASLDQLIARFLRTSACTLLSVDFIKRRHSAA
jgi:hypothetical protein